MKKNQKTITIRLDEETAEKIYNYLRSETTTKPENQKLLQIINIGLDVNSGAYQNFEILKLVDVVKAQTRMLNITSENIKFVNSAIADLQDAFTKQVSDQSLLIEKQTGD